MRLIDKITAVCLGILMVFGVGAMSQDALAQEKLWEKVQNEGVLKVGAAVAAPHAIRDPKTGEWSGVAIDVLRKFAEGLDVELKVVDTTWDNIIAGMQAGKWDIAVALNRTQRRALAINYSQPYWFYQISLVFNKNNDKIDPSWKSLADFDKEGITIALMSGTAQDHSITPLIKNATISRLPDFDSSRMAVIARRADVLADDADGNMLFAESNSEWSGTVIPDPAIARQGIAFGFRKSVPLEEILALDILVEQLRAEGVTDRWMKHYVAQILSQSK
ncbi:MAG: transporter substrate-binding domain-containing protein [Proteobacteria bacterium]|nr:transporter substrate-binding domain-containing protein [Pseudomonadota bacterium]